jgi:hypothetical protein
MEIEDILMRNEQLVLENEALRQQIQDIKNGLEGSCYACESVGVMNKELLKERDEAWLLNGRIFNEIDCRIEHGADSNGHLEAIRNLFKENKR